VAVRKLSDLTPESLKAGIERVVAVPPSDPETSPNGKRPEIEPDPLPLVPTNATTFPLEALPAGVARYARAVAEDLNVSVDAAAVVCLSVLSAGVGASVKAQIKDSWKDGAVLWVALVMPPGSGKTTVIRQIAGPLDDKQTAWFDMHAIEVEEWQTKEDGKPKGARPDPRPTTKRLVVDDTTVERLAGILNENPRGVLQKRDEMTGWIKSLNQYRGGKGADKQFYLSSWSGTRATIDRKNAPDPVHVPRPNISLLGGIQPDLLSELADPQAREDGFTDRFLFCHPPTKKARWTEDKISPELQEFWRCTVHALLAVPLRPDDTPNIRNFTAEGLKAWVSMWEKLRAEEESIDLPTQLARAYTKLESYALRFSLILHETKLAERWAASGAVPVATRQASMELSIVRRMDGEDDSEEVPVDGVVAFDDGSLIEADTVYSAWAIVDYFKGQLDLIHGRLTQTPYDHRLHQMYEYLKAHDGKATTVDLVNHKVARCGSRNDVLYLASGLKSRGWAEVVPRPNKNGPASTVVRLLDCTR
jgi:Protein of unknown function (DUF3987)